MTISRQVFIDSAKADLMQAVRTISNNNNLSLSEMELVLYQVLADIKTEKEVQYSGSIIELLNQVQKLEEEKKKQLQEQVLQVEKKEE